MDCPEPISGAPFSVLSLGLPLMKRPYFYGRSDIYLVERTEKEERALNPRGLAICQRCGMCVRRETGIFYRPQRPGIDVGRYRPGAEVYGQNDRQ